MQFGKINGFVLMGGGQLMGEFGVWLLEQGYKVETYTTIRYFQSGYNIVEDINTSLGFSVMGRLNYIGIGFGEDFTFTQETIDAFQGRLVDFMGIPLPRYRGGAHWTWAILNGEKEWGSCIQLITPEMKQGVFDNGDIVTSQVFKFGDYKIPQDLMDKVTEEGLDQLKRFVNGLKQDKDFNLTKIDEKKSEYYPRLNTELDAMIDWSWNVHDIHRFICAFDKPYVGAWTSLSKKKVHLRDCSSIVDGIHPFTSGLVIQKSDEGIFVNAPLGRLLIKDYPKEVKVGDRFESMY